MLSAAIAVLFVGTGLVAAATVAHSLREAHALYLRLVREGEIMRAGFALQAAAAEMSLRPNSGPGPRRAAAIRRAAMLRQLPLPARAAA
jgi:hypothetical protein